MQPLVRIHAGNRRWFVPGIYFCNGKEKTEIERILALLSQMVSPITNELQENTILIGKIDFAFAKAKLRPRLGWCKKYFQPDAYPTAKNTRGHATHSAQCSRIQCGWIQAAFAGEFANISESVVNVGKFYNEAVEMTKSIEKLFL